MSIGLAVDPVKERGNRSYTVFQGGVCFFLSAHISRFFLKGEENFCLFLSYDLRVIQFQGREIAQLVFASSTFLEVTQLQGNLASFCFGDSVWLTLWKKWQPPPRLSLVCLNPWVTSPPFCPGTAVWPPLLLSTSTPSCSSLLYIGTTGAEWYWVRRRGGLDTKFPST